MTHLSTSIFTSLILVAGSALAQTPAQATATSTTAVESVEAEKSEAEVRKVDLGAGKITLRHGVIKNLDKPPMNMVFQVKDPALLGQFKVGDKVKFTADKINGAYTVLTLEPAQ